MNVGLETGSTDFDIWQESYAARANNLKASEIRSLFSVVSRPEVVSLAGGMPNIHDLPLPALAESAAELIRNYGEQAMQYGGGQGWQPLREQITSVMELEGYAGNPDNVVVTTGSQQAIDLVTQIFINPGDVILAESPSYVGALGVFNAAQAEVVHIAMDADGLIPDVLEETIIEQRKRGKKIKFLYTIPNYHNPGGICLSAERRPQIVEICTRLRVVIVEDNPYGLLGFAGEIKPTLLSYNPDTVIYLGSFSKIFAPGYRVGWAYVPSAIRDKMVVALESAILCPAMAGQMSISTYLRDYDWQAQINNYRKIYFKRCQATLSALESYLPQCSWTVPTGGFYTWVTLPKGLNSKSMLPRAVTELVAYTPGTAFYADGQGTEYLRICYSYPPEERIQEGIRRLAKVVSREQELVQLFGSNYPEQAQN